MKKIALFLLLLTMSLSTVTHSNPLKLGQTAFNSGDFELAIKHWEDELAKTAPTSQTTQYIDIAVHLAVAYQNLGLSEQAIKVLQLALPHAQGYREHYANLLSHLGDIYLIKGEWRKAESYLNKAETFARQTKNSLLLANILNKQGNLWMARGDLKSALEDIRNSIYDSCINQQSAKKAEEPKLRYYNKRGFSLEDKQKCLLKLEQLLKLDQKYQKYSSCINMNALNQADKNDILTDDAIHCIATAKAIERYQECQENSAEDNMLTAKTWLNLAWAKLKNKQTQEAEKALEKALEKAKLDKAALEKAKPIDYSHDQVYMLLNAVQLRNELSKTEWQRQPEFIKKSYPDLKNALIIADKLHDYRAISYAYGYLAQIYEADKQRYKEAIQLTKQAISYARRVGSDSPYLLSSWEGQLGGLFKKQGLLEGKLLFDKGSMGYNAIAAYQRAIEHLKDIRPALQRGYRNVSQPFREREGKPYFELADLLLQQSKQKAKGSPEQQDLLKKARDTIESYKIAELQDYFKDECIIKRLPVNQIKVQDKDIDEDLPNNTALLYPILFDNQIELLLSISGEKIKLFSKIETNRNTVMSEINNFREQIEQVGNIESYAKQLYQWLIKPIADELKNKRIDTLVIVSGGDLAAIPFAALSDDNGRYLIESYAIAVTPSMRLTDTTPFKHQNNIHALLHGLSAEESGLEYVDNEIKEIKSLLNVDDSDTLMNEEFTLDNVKTKLESRYYSVVHFSTHAYFDQYEPNNSSLLTYNKKEQLNMNRLREFMGIRELYGKPVELLTLSACQTAVGNEKAALGLAGAAINIGVRSVLGTLWSVNDKSSADFIKAFYQEWTTTNYSFKAKALQKAMKQQLNNNDLKHPFFWSGFLLIGNWL